jgi:flavin prenyltransferase
MKGRKIIIAITGASGSIYALNLIEKIERYKGDFSEVAVIFSKTGKKVCEYETGESPSFREPFKLYKNKDLFGAPASGSSGFDCMVVIPCSMGTLSRIAAGNAQTLIERSADVMLKERRKLILVARETPLSLIHIKNMERVTLAGGIILPASPSFYRKPKTINDLVDSVTERVMSFIIKDYKGFEWR